MKLTTAFVLSFLVSEACAQQFQYPAIKRNAQQLTDFVPSGWEIRDQATGDLNKDGLADAALVLERSTRNGVADEQDSTASALPRILVVLFKSAGNKGYALSAQSNSFILTQEDPEMDDPFTGISIARGALKIGFQYFRKDSHDDTSTSAYKFRHDGRHFVLIGADVSVTGRMSYTFQEYSYNFLTRKCVLSTGDLGEAPSKTITKSFSLPVLKTLETFTKPGTWNIEKDFTL